MRIAPAVVALLYASYSGAALAETSSDEWQYGLTPYLWLPTIGGTLKYDLPPGSGGSPDVSVGPSDWLDLLNFGALVGGTARKGRFSIYGDLVYLSMTSKNDGRVDSITEPGSPTPIPISPGLNLNTRTDLSGLTWTLAAGYSLQQTDTASLDLFAGVRFFGIDVSTSWNLTSDITLPGGGLGLPAQGSIGTDTDLWDGILGARGHFSIGSGNWTVPYYLDVGAGSSDLTWNALTGVAFAFDWGDLMLTYRHLEYDQDADSLLQDFSFSGPALGARFRF